VDYVFVRAPARAGGPAIGRMHHRAVARRYGVRSRGIRGLL